MDIFFKRTELSFQRDVINCKVCKTKDYYYAKIVSQAFSLNLCSLCYFQSIGSEKRICKSWKKQLFCKKLTHIILQNSVIYRYFLKIKKSLSNKQITNCQIQRIRLYNTWQHIKRIQGIKRIEQMKNTLLDKVGDKIETTKQTLSNLFKQCHPQSHPRDQLDFQNILSQKNHLEPEDSHKAQQTPLQIKYKQSLINSILAKTIEHETDSKKIEQILEEQSQFIKNIENEISQNKSSQILNLQSCITPQQQKICLSGVLQKFSPSLFGGWSERYCTLTKNKFIYHEDKNPHSPLAGFINFSILSFSTHLNFNGTKPESFEIKVDKGQKNFVFKGYDSNETQAWFQKIKQFIESSEGKANNITALSNYNRFWRKEYMTQKQFQNNAQTGDIILFRGKKTSALIQRAFLGEEYDHVGFILRNAFNQILIFEANGGLGVGICPWKKFIKHRWFEDQEIIAIRHLKIKRTEQFLSEVTKFVSDNIGKEYKFSIKNYLMSRSSTVDSEKNSYFCSSLVAKIYKRLGLLDPVLSSTRYKPQSFSQKEKMLILNGRHGEAELQRQKIIVFEKKNKNKIFEKIT